MKKNLFESLAIVAVAFSAVSAPIPSYRVATNIAEAVSRTVVSNTVTRSYIEDLGISGSSGRVNATNIINYITHTSTDATLINRTYGQEDNPIVSIGSVNAASNTAGLMTVDDKKKLDYVVSNLDAKADKTSVYTKNEVDAKGYVTKAVTNGLATAESVDVLASDVSGKADAAIVYTKAEVDSKYNVLSTEINSIGNSTSVLINQHTLNKNNPHAVTAAQVGAVPFVEDDFVNKTAVTIGSRISYERVGEHSLANGVNVIASGPGSHSEGDSTTASGYYSHSEGKSTTALGDYSHAEGDSTAALGDYSHAGGFHSQTRDTDHYAYSWSGEGTIFPSYTSHGPGTFNINPVGGLDGFYIGGQTLHAILTNKADKADISATDPTFSNAVLAVGLNIDTNSVAVLNDIAATFGGFPLGASETATTVGGLLAALAAAIAWLKKNKVGSFDNVGGASATVENGVAKLEGFFTNSNSLLTATIDARLPYPLNAVPSTGMLKDRAINTTSLASVTVPDNFTDLLVRASVETSLAVTMPEAIATKYGDTFPGEAGEYLITITKTGAAEAYVRTIKLEEVANA